MGQHRGERHAEVNSDRRLWPSRLWPGRPLGYALAILSVLIVGVCIYAASDLVRDLTLSGTPGPGAADTGDTTDLGQDPGDAGVVNGLFQGEVPGGGGVELDQTGTTNGAEVTLVRAYADANSVVVAFTVEDLSRERRVGGYPAELQQGFAGLRLADENGTAFRLESAGGAVSSGPNSILQGPQANTAVFEAQGRIEPGSEHRFRLEVPILEVPVTRPGEEGQTPEGRPVGQALDFTFEAPVRPAPVVQVGTKVTSSGITLTLERITDSEGQPEAVFCLESRDGVSGWLPSGDDLSPGVPSPLAGERPCLQTPLSHSLAGSSSVTVEQVEINPANDGEVVRGPWRFDFEVPGS